MDSTLNNTLIVLGFFSLQHCITKLGKTHFPLIPQHPYELRIDFRINGQEMFAEYSTFRIEDESDKYGCVAKIFETTGI